MKTTWIVVADASLAKIFSVNKIKFLNDQDQLHLIKELSHPASRLRDADIVSDKAGRYRAKDRTSDSFFEPTEPKHHEAEIFAHEIIAYLTHAASLQSFDEFILTAAPAFHGLMNKHMPAHLKSLLSLSFEKDYIKDDLKTLALHLKKQIG
jgi:protein required for attachment to host cells